MKKTVIALLLVLALSLSLVACGSGTDAKDEKFNIVLITMDFIDGHWKKVDAGCQAAVKEIGEDKITYKWDAPQDGKQDSQQIECINNAVAGGADVILLAAHDKTAQNGAIQAGIDAGVKFIFVDSPADINDAAILQTISTNNKAAGQKAGEAMLAALAELDIKEGTIGVVSPDAGSASVIAREEGFNEAFAGSAFEILETQYCDGGDNVVAQQKAADFITNGVVGIFASNEGSSVGVANAIKEAGGNVVGVGFDISETVANGIKDASLYAGMAQEPYQMGFKGINNAYAYLANGTAPAPAVEDSGSTVVTKDNVGDYS